RHRASESVAVDVETIVAAALRGEDAAVEEFIAAARSDFAALQPHLPPLLYHERAELRAAACRAIGASADSRTWAGQLVVRASDADWRVRAAAYEALHALQPLDAMPLRDTPMAERDAILLDWVARFDASLGTQLAAQRCELYARSDHLQ